MRIRRTRLRILALGAAMAFVLASGVARAAPGDLDSSFGNGGVVLSDLGASSDDSASAVAIQANGKVVVAGSSNSRGGFDFALVRYNRDGSLDPSFGDGGIVLTDLGSAIEGAFDVATQPDGKIVATGHSTAGGSFDFALVRYNRDGSLDASFGNGGIVLSDLGASSDDSANAVAIQANGKLVVAGASNAGGRSDFALVRYDRDGSLDPSFGNGGIVLTRIGSGSFANDVAPQPDGKIVAAGTAGSLVNDTVSLIAVARYDGDGSLDENFGSGGIVLTLLVVGSDLEFEGAIAIALQPNGKIVAAGVRGTGRHSASLVVRYNKDGSLDSSFGNNGGIIGTLGFESRANGVAVQANGKVVIAGRSDVFVDNFPLEYGFHTGFTLARFNGDGSLDQSFGSGGIVFTDLFTVLGLGCCFDVANDVALQPDGSIVAAGTSFTRGSLAFALARYDG